jgi:hypothetical protein
MPPPIGTQAGQSREVVVPQGVVYRTIDHAIQFIESFPPDKRNNLQLTLMPQLIVAREKVNHLIAAVTRYTLDTKHWKRTASEQEFREQL